MDFFGRKTELTKLDKRYDDNNFECIVIYGRRRVGKTALINRFCDGRKTIYFSALNSTSVDNLRALSKSIYQTTYPNAESFPEYHSYDDAFNEITRLAKDERIIFVIDEYPYLAKAEASISSMLQHLIDHVWQDSKLFIILCGSSMNFMQHQVLGYESPLYGRRTAQFKIEPLDYKEVANFNNELIPEEYAYIYGITGGIPHYINKLNVIKDVDEALLNNFFDTSSYLFEEPENLIKQELREPALYNAIVSAIAGGSSKLNEIATKVGIETSTASKYLNVLLELGIVKKETPFGQKIGKKTIYLLEDELFRFWYRFVPKNMSVIASDRMRMVYDSAVKVHLHDYMGIVFEKMCKQYLLYYAENLPFEIADIGQWWGTDTTSKKEVQIDIVASAVNTDSAVKKYIIGSCKFINEKVGIEEFNVLRKYASVYGMGDEYYYYMFSLNGFTKELEETQIRGEVTLVELKDMY